MSYIQVMSNVTWTSSSTFVRVYTFLSLQRYIGNVVTKGLHVNMILRCHFTINIVVKTFSLRSKFSTLSSRLNNVRFVRSMNVVLDVTTWGIFTSKTRFDNVEFKHLHNVANKPIWWEHNVFVTFSTLTHIFHIKITFWQR